MCRGEPSICTIKRPLQKSFLLWYTYDMNATVDIHKSGGVLIKDRRLLVTRSKGKDIFIAPGGKLEEGETAVQAIVREMME